MVYGQWRQMTMILFTYARNVSIKSTQSLVTHTKCFLDIFKRFHSWWNRQLQTWCYFFSLCQTSGLKPHLYFFRWFPFLKKGNSDTCEGRSCWIHILIKSNCPLTFGSWRAHTWSEQVLDYHMFINQVQGGASQLCSKLVLLLVM